MARHPEVVSVNPLVRFPEDKELVLCLTEG